jgi:hypothetical protein
VASGRFHSAHVFQDYEGRVFDIHLKDKKVSATENGDVAVDTFIGEGDAKLDQLVKAAAEAGYDGVFALESDAGYSDPTEHIEKAGAWFSKHTSPEALAEITVDERQRRGFGGRGPRRGPPGGGDGERRGPPNRE